MSCTYHCYLQYLKPFEPTLNVFSHFYFFINLFLWCHSDFSIHAKNLISFQRDTITEASLLIFQKNVFFFFKFTHFSFDFVEKLEVRYFDAILHFCKNQLDWSMPRIVWFLWRIQPKEDDLVAEILSSSGNRWCSYLENNISWLYTNIYLIKCGRYAFTKSIKYLRRLVPLTQSRWPNLG